MNPKRIVIIGGVAGGASAAARARRLSETSEILVLERGPHVSFANCGLPYFVGGEIAEASDLLVQTPESLKARLNLDVRVRTEVTSIDRLERVVRARDAATGEVSRQECGGLFVFIGADAETGWLPDDIARDARGYVLTGEDLKKAGRWSHGRDPYLLETSVPGVFACGDVRLSPVKRVAAAVGEGSMAIALIRQFLASAG